MKWATVWDALLDTFFPHPQWISRTMRGAQKALADAEIDQITSLVAPPSGAADLLEAARLVLEDEDGRKAAAENRATTFLAAVAALIPLLTWAVGTATPVCSPGFGCNAWSLAFILAVFYLVLAGFWSLRALSVANYHCVGVEDIRKFWTEADFELAAAKETLIAARLNRDTINRKLTFIKVAQRCFYQALFLLALLLMIDPIARYGLLRDKAPSKDKPETSLCAPAPNPALESKLPAAPAPAVSASPPMPASQPAQPNAAPAAPTPEPAKPAETSSGG